MKYFALIVGGGSGTRMKSDIPKQFLSINGKPVLMHTIEAFYFSIVKPEIIVVLSRDFHSFWQQLCLHHHFTIPHQIVDGGENRFYSVKNALPFIDEASAIVAVHDAVRPIVSNELITNCFQEAARRGAVVCGIVSRDSIRQIVDNTSRALNRESIYLMQTPQAFQVEVLKEAYTQTYSTEFTDDASVVENAGHKIHIVEGESANIKITYPEDLAVAELLQKKIRHEPDNS